MSGNIFENNRQTYLDSLSADIREFAAKEGISTAFAAERAIALRLGYDVDDIDFVDGAGDRGIDFWFASEVSLSIYQVKTHDIEEKGIIDFDTPFDNEGVSDLTRAYYFILGDEVPDSAHRLSRLKDAFDRLVRNYINRDEADKREPIDVNLTLIILGSNFTEQAFAELAAFESQLRRPIDYGGANVQFHIEIQTIDDILKAAWRENNRDWFDSSGKKRESIRLTPMKQSDERHYLNDGRSAIFYCRAKDLVDAYLELGYQIFEPNVRANIRNSNVNSDIQKSASHNASMKEFRFLNNGLTITCTNYKTPHGQRLAFEVDRPGIVNGLQTVIALHRAYRALDDKQKQFFDDNCFVLVRLLRNDAVDRISQVVLATNNQNPMQVRNLRSNTAEQIHFSQFFAREMHWFYEAKQGAWDAFKDDPTRWRPQISQNARAFKVKGGNKKVDNLDLAQHWLSFLGFSDKAANEKKYLFEETYYPLIFLQRPRKHAYMNYNSIEDAAKDSESQTPDPYTMLVAHLSYIFASNVVPSSIANRKAALAHAGVETRGQISPAEEERILSEDAEYSLNQALNTMSLIFVEFIGFCLFKVYQADAHRCGQVILKTRSWKALYENLDWQAGVDLANGVNTNFDDNDLLVVSWLFFREAVETLMNGAWQVPYHNERYKPRFVLRNRHQVYQEILKMDASLRRKVPLRVWTQGIGENEGFFGYLQRNIDNLWR